MEDHVITELPVFLTAEGRGPRSEEMRDFFRWSVLVFFQRSASYSKDTLHSLDPSRVTKKLRLGRDRILWGFGIGMERLTRLRV